MDTYDILSSIFLAVIITSTLALIAMVSAKVSQYKHRKHYDRLRKEADENR
jgi:uncharacterized membrane protein